ncbi:hypothetical protein EMIT091MI3_50112 [Kosakonia quasisacchari]
MVARTGLFDDALTFVTTTWLTELSFGVAIRLDGLTNHWCEPSE